MKPSSQAQQQTQLCGKSLKVRSCVLWAHHRLHVHAELHTPCNAHIPCLHTLRLSLLRSGLVQEWSVAVKALGAGEQTVLFRKGGIREPLFKPESKEFLLFPTGFHTDQQLLKDGVAGRYQAVRGVPCPGGAVHAAAWQHMLQGHASTYAHPSKHPSNEVACVPAACILARG